MGRIEEWTELTQHPITVGKVDRPKDAYKLDYAAITLDAASGTMVLVCVWSCMCEVGC